MLKTPYTNQQMLDLLAKAHALPTDLSFASTPSSTNKVLTEQQSYHRNLLDNPMFKIDQREGYIIPSGTAYYSDSGLTTQVGTTSADRNGMAGNGTYGRVYINDGWYYCAWSSSFVRGYVGNTPRNISRWLPSFSGGNGRVLVTDDGVTIITEATNGNIYQLISPEDIEDGNYTYSVMEKNGDIATFHASIQETTVTMLSRTETDNVKLIVGYSSPYFWVNIIAKNTNTPTYIKVAMFEGGDISTIQKWVASKVYKKYKYTDLQNCMIRELYRIKPISTYSRIGWAIGENATTLMAFFPQPFVSPKTPTMSFMGKIRYNNLKGSAGYISSLSDGHLSVSSLISCKAISATSNIVAGDMYGIYVDNDQTAYIDAERSL